MRTQAKLHSAYWCRKYSRQPLEYSPPFIKGSPLSLALASSFSPSYSLFDIVGVGSGARALEDGDGGDAVADGGGTGRGSGEIEEARGERRWQQLKGQSSVGPDIKSEMRGGEEVAALAFLRLLLYEFPYTDTSLGVGEFVVSRIEQDLRGSGTREGQADRKNAEDAGEKSEGARVRVAAGAGEGQGDGRKDRESGREWGEGEEARQLMLEICRTAELCWQNADPDGRCLVSHVCVCVCACGYDSEC